MITIPNTFDTLYMVGDCHGNWNTVLYNIRNYNIRNSVFIFCGDVGIGFEKLDYYKNIVIPNLNKTLSKFNNMFIWFRGNHDDPTFFINQLIDTKYIKCISDYTIINMYNKNILVIGGGISIDRTIRQHTDAVKVVNYMKYHNCDYNKAEKNCTKCYWEDETIKYQPKVSEHIDIICSHSAPSFCSPIGIGNIVKQFAESDPTLLEDVRNERLILDKIYEDYKDDISFWYYGHYHISCIQNINNILFTALNISEISKHDWTLNDNITM